ncbi:TOBE domain-containing protein [Adlercreutzia murintestinalis]|uniref:TOBE domain-containing protein n=1 Tax=Adlercreutzia murintestinalis TaxID=2941325 RepID=UPI00203DB7F0|nr:TOBE domain-containing protein [Adlercreutzia murintestinalis]
MKISARNQLKGTVSNIQEGAVNGVVTIDVHDTKIKADITMEAIRDLGLEVGKEASAIVKASSVMFATDIIPNISARNQVKGKVVDIEKGAVNGHVAIELPCGCKMKGSITNEAIEQLGLAKGNDAVAIVKATEVMVGVE